MSVEEQEGTPLEWDVVPNCFISHLKIIELKVLICGEDVEKVKYILKNTKVLEKLIMETCKCEDCCENLKMVCEDIFKHRRGSMTWSDRNLVISFA